MTLRGILQKALERNDLDLAVSLARQNRRVFSQLIRLAYDKETLVGWRAIIAMGMAASSLIQEDRDFLRETCRKLLWSLTDESGGIGWSAPELLGEIVSIDPERFVDLIPLIASAYEVEEHVFRPGVLYALGRIAEKHPELVVSYQKIIILSLTDREPLVRIRGLELVAALWQRVKACDCWSREYCDRIARTVSCMNTDQGEAWVYREDGFHSVLVSDESKKINKLIS